LSKAFSRNTQARAERTLQQQTDERQANEQRAAGIQKAGNTYLNNSAELSYLRSNTVLPDTATASETRFVFITGAANFHAHLRDNYSKNRRRNKIHQR